MSVACRINFRYVRQTAGTLELQVRLRQFYPQDKYIEGGSSMTGTDLYVNKPHCAAAVRP